MIMELPPWPYATPPTGACSYGRRATQWVFRIPGPVAAECAVCPLEAALAHAEAQAARIPELRERLAKAREEAK